MEPDLLNANPGPDRNCDIMGTFLTSLLQFLIYLPPRVAKKIKRVYIHKVFRHGAWPSVSCRLSVPSPGLGAASFANSHVSL